MRKEQPNILLVHGSDLFFGSGTAMIYRRLLGTLVDTHNVIHWVGPHRSAEESELRECYKTGLPGIQAIFSPGLTRLKLTEKVARHMQGKPSLYPSVRWASTRLTAVIEETQPDLIWWSGDYLPWSLGVLDRVYTNSVSRLPLQFSLYDPPEFWKLDDLALYRKVLGWADGVDVVSHSLQERVLAEGNDTVTILHDYIDHSFVAPSVDCGNLSVAIAGQIYEAHELQEFIDLLATTKRAATLHWFGNAQNYIVADQLHLPESITLVREGTLPREALVETISHMHMAYLSMPASRPAFSRYSVPTKLMTYFAAGLPIAYHAPEYSEVDAMNRRSGFGINLQKNPSTTDLLRLIEQRNQFQSAIQSLVNERFKKDIVATRLRKMIEARLGQTVSA